MTEPFISRASLATWLAITGTPRVRDGPAYVGPFTFKPMNAFICGSRRGINAQCPATNNFCSRMLKGQGRSNYVRRAQQASAS